MTPETKKDSGCIKESLERLKQMPGPREIEIRDPIELPDREDPKSSKINSQ
jgi:hypothetical protein